MTTFNIGSIINNCTERTINAFQRSFELALQMHHEFILPEHLLQAIIEQDELKQYCSVMGIPHNILLNELNDFFKNIEGIATDGAPELSSGYKEILKQLEVFFATDDEAISVIDLLNVILSLEDSFAAAFVKNYIWDEDDAWEEDLYDYYSDDCSITSQRLMLERKEKEKEKEKEKKKKTAKKEEESPEVPENKKMTLPNIKGCNVQIITPDNMGDDDFLNNLMSQAGKLFSSMGGFTPDGNIDFNIHPNADKKDRTGKKENWEMMVTNISEQYKKQNALIGREEELDLTIQVLCQKDKNNPLHIGEAGVGKTALVYGLAREIDNGRVPQALKDCTIYMMDMGSLIAGTSFHGEFERRIKEIMDGMKRRGNCICYIDEIHNIMNANGGGNGSIDASNLLKPYLEDGSIRFIGSTTYQEYNRYMAKSKGIVRRFQQIDIQEPSVGDTLKILEGIIPEYEKHHRVKYDHDAIVYAVEQSARLIADRYLPDKAISILDRAGAYRQTHPKYSKNGVLLTPGRQKVDVALVGDILAKVCKINAKALVSDNNDTLKTLDKRIGSEIYGQQPAIDQVVRAVKLSKAGLTMGEKPLASLLFVGPTGVGKTEVCKVLAKELGIDLVRFDMSEYTEKHAVAKLIGSPAGYVGYDDGGLLTDAIRKSPNCVLLLDEIEKAHEDIYNILLQVMDYASLTDNRGNKVDFKNVILIMTSNAGAQFADQAAIGFGGGQSKGESMLQTVKKTFKPEFINRLSGTVVFNDMDETMAALILDKKLRQLSELLGKKQVSLTLTPEAHAFLLKKGFSHQYGAREMDRVIQEHLTPILMDEILFGKLQKGGAITITENDSNLIIQR